MTALSKYDKQVTTRNLQQWALAAARCQYQSNFNRTLMEKGSKTVFCGESTDISNCSQLLVFVHFLDNDNIIKEELLFSQELETTSKGIHVMNITEYFQKHNIMWEKLVVSCTDGTPAMLGSRSSLATLIRQKNPSVLTMHCIIHRQALASKTLPKCLNNTMQLAVKMVNVIKSSALNTRIFQKLCSEIDTDHENLLFHTEVR
ncbi:protein FAM200C-like [Centruroides vittatus]|uniref:protein FAM200C-like n=1 Tax=Centruroides vittatus TaxID=120091 RepID=UPI00350F1F80